MILYLDTSSLVKLYLDEEYSDRVLAWTMESDVVATSRVAYPEASSAFARRFHEGDLDEDEFLALRQALDRDWQDFSAVDLTAIVCAASMPSTSPQCSIWSPKLERIRSPSRRSIVDSIRQFGQKAAGFWKLVDTARSLPPRSTAHSFRAQTQP